MNLCIDIGNTRTKIGIFLPHNVPEVFSFERGSTRKLSGVVPLENIKKCIISSTIHIEKSLMEELRSVPQLLILDENTVLPFKNRYETPYTLGKDRLALVAAAVSLYPGQNVLVIGCGTCITFNFKNVAEEFIGGSIHPGLKMRLQAMHTFTGKLPLVPLQRPTGWISNSTEASLLTGAVMGAASEIDGMIAEYAKNYKDLTVLLTGGDSELLVSMLKNKIFALPDLTLVGLNKILESNVQTDFA